MKNLHDKYKQLSPTEDLINIDLNNLPSTNNPSSALNYVASHSNNLSNNTINTSDIYQRLMNKKKKNGCTTIVTRIWTATDDCGNDSTATQVITRTDSTAPIFANVPSDITIDCTDDLPTDEPTVSDNCGNVDLVSDEDTQVNGCTTIVTRTWTATDEYGNVATATQVIARTGSTAPIFANVP